MRPRPPRVQSVIDGGAAAELPTLLIGGILEVVREIAAGEVDVALQGAGVDIRELEDHVRTLAVAPAFVHATRGLSRGLLTRGKSNH